MPVKPTYPGVYIEEIPSGVHTITGVATSVTAFLGYSPRGPTEPTEIFGPADFERSFGGLAADSPLSYAVSQFFQNGGSDAFVVRIAPGAAPASVDLQDKVAAGQTVLTLTADSVGTWGNALQADVDYNTVNPNSLFNLTITEYALRDGTLVVRSVEVFRNLSMDQYAPTYAVDTVNAGSKLVTLTAGSLTGLYGTGTSQSAVLTLTGDVAKLGSPATTMNNRVAVSVNGGAAVEVVFFDASNPLLSGTLDQVLSDIATKIAQAVNAQLGPNAITGTAPLGQGVLHFQAAPPPVGQESRAAVHFVRASRADATAILKLGVGNGGIEIDGAAPVRPAQTGTVGGPLGVPAFGTTLKVNVNVEVAGTSIAATAAALTVWDSTAATPIPAPTDYATAAALLQKALDASTLPGLAGATVAFFNATLRVVPGGSNPNVMLTFSDGGGTTNISSLGLNSPPATANAAHYALGVGVTEGAQTNAIPGADGTPPQDTDFVGDPVAKTGMYALEKVDLFNLLCLVDVQTESVLGTAATYCEQRRAFLIFDLPKTIGSVADAAKWMQDPAKGGQIASRNAAAYVPRFDAADPLLSNRLRSFPACGAIAGVYARIDGQRGVWKAPAGQEAYVLPAAALDVPLTNAENGVLNPLGLNCLRAFPGLGIVVWGARTMRGSDLVADDYKYVPVRRLALYLEESLYRGTQWVVFEPNDEPLWAQIRLNVGAFMHDLYGRGAFAGQTPRDAYFVRCDKQTTTPLDQDLGRVNIIVGFAPLKPAEFVIIQIQQILPPLAT